MKPINFPLITTVCSIALGVFLAIGLVWANSDKFAKKEEPYKYPTISIEQWADSVTTVKGKNVYLNLGDRAGGGGSSDDERLCIKLLSPILKKHPKAINFTVLWGYTVAMGSDELKIFYSRKTKTLSSAIDWRGSPPNRRKFKPITDSMIHAAARRYDSYTNVKRYK